MFATLYFRFPMYVYLEVCAHVHICKYIFMNINLHKIFNYVASLGIPYFVVFVTFFTVSIIVCYVLKTKLMILYDNVEEI